MITCVFQDCALCGDRGKKVKKIVADNNLHLVLKSFASDEGKKLCHEAVFKHGIATMPFYTDGKKFSTKLEDFVKNLDCQEFVDYAKTAKAITKKPTKKTTKKAEVKQDESV